MLRIFHGKSLSIHFVIWISSLLCVSCFQSTCSQNFECEIPNQILFEDKRKLIIQQKSCLDPNLLSAHSVSQQKLRNTAFIWAFSEYLLVVVKLAERKGGKCANFPVCGSGGSPLLNCRTSSLGLPPAQTSLTQNSSVTKNQKPPFLFCTASHMHKKLKTNANRGLVEESHFQPSAFSISAVQ